MLSTKKLVLLAACVALTLVPSAADQSGHLRAHRQLNEDSDISLDSLDGSGSVEDSVDDFEDTEFESEDFGGSETDFGSESDSTDASVRV